MIMTYLIIPVIVIILIQLAINLGFGFILKEKSIKIYKVLSLMVSIGIAISFPIISIWKGLNGEELDSMFIPNGRFLITLWFWGINIIATSSFQLIFNIYFLKRIILRRQIR